MIEFNNFVNDLYLLLCSCVYRTRSDNSYRFNDNSISYINKKVIFYWQLYYVCLTIKINIKKENIYQWQFGQISYVILFTADNYVINVVIMIGQNPQIHYPLLTTANWAGTCNAVFFALSCPKWKRKQNRKWKWNRNWICNFHLSLPWSPASLAVS